MSDNFWDWIWPVAAVVVIGSLLCLGVWKLAELVLTVMTP